MKFDHSQIYYRVLGGPHPYYAYTEGEPEQMANGRGRLASAEPVYQFERLEKIGQWLFLGDRVRRLRVPRTARVIENRPMSQGGCYSFSADQVELLDELDFATLMKLLDASPSPARLLHIERYELPAGFAFPRGLSIVILDRCLSVTPLAFPDGLHRLALWGCALVVGRWPAAVESFEASKCVFEGADPPAQLRASLQASTSG